MNERLALPRGSSESHFCSVLHTTPHSRSRGSKKKQTAHVLSCAGSAVIAAAMEVGQVSEMTGSSPATGPWEWQVAMALNQVGSIEW